MMFLDRPYPVSPEVLADSLLLHVSRECVFGLIEADASFSRRMLAGLSMRLHSLLADVESYSCAPAPSGRSVTRCSITGAPEREVSEGTIDVVLPTTKR